MYPAGQTLQHFSVILEVIVTLSLNTVGFYDGLLKTSFENIFSKYVIESNKAYGQ